MTPHPLDALIPIIITFLKQSGLSRQVNAWIAVAAYVIWTALSLWFGLRGVTGPITPETFVTQLVVAATTGFVSYQLIWKNLPGDAEQVLEEKTSIIKGPVTDPIIDDSADTGSNG